MHDSKGCQSSTRETRALGAEFCTHVAGIYCSKSASASLAMARLNAMHVSIRSLNITPQLRSLLIILSSYYSLLAAQKSLSDS